MSELAIKLAAGVAEMGLDISAEQQQKLLDFVALIFKWNAVHNLTAVREPSDMITLHLLDSMSVLPYIDCKRLLDVGAGAGLPSIVLAICLPELKVTAIDSVQKKVSFMRQVKAQLKIPNLTLIHGRIEEQEIADEKAEEKFDLIISRAFSEIGLFVKLTKHLLSKDGKWLAMKGSVPHQELTDVGVNKTYPLAVAGLEAERHLIVIENN